MYGLNDQGEIVPRVGLGATVCYLNDREAYTIVDVSPSLKTIVLQRDRAIRKDRRGLSEDQEWLFVIDPNGTKVKATLRKDGCYRVSGTNLPVYIGERQEYRSPHI